MNKALDWIHTESWPLVRIDWPADLSVEEFDAYAQTLRSLFLRRERFAIVIQLPSAGPPTPAVRHKIVEFERSCQDETRRWVAGLAYIVDGTIQRAILTALDWLRSNRAAPQLRFATRQEAERWAYAQLSERNRTLQRKD
jgi:hypothetical protein